MSSMGEGAWEEDVRLGRGNRDKNTSKDKNKGNEPRHAADGRTPDTQSPAEAGPGNPSWHYGDSRPGGPPWDHDDSRQGHEDGGRQGHEQDSQGPGPTEAPPQQGQPSGLSQPSQPAQVGYHQPAGAGYPQHVTDDGLPPMEAPNPPTAFTSGLPPASAGMGPGNAADRPAVSMSAVDVEAPAPPGTPGPAGEPPDPEEPMPSRVKDAPAPEDLAPPDLTDAAAPLPPARPQIPLPGPSAVPDSLAGPSAPDPDDSGPRAFPEPLVIGDTPALRSDPRGLPEPDQVPGPLVPDTVLDGADLDGLLIRCASLRGDSHRYNGIVRQDSMGMWLVSDSETQAVLVCVTDGVSREPLSHRGAAEACRFLREGIARDVTDLLKPVSKRRVQPTWQEIAEYVGSCLSAMAGYLGVAPRALSTTLAGALIELNPDDPERRRFVIFNVGDATGFILSGGEFSSLLVDPHNTTITSTATYALPTSIGQAGIEEGFIAPGDMLMVCTDGMSNPMRDPKVCDQLAGWWGDDQVPSMPEFGWQMSYRVKTYDDDRTAICVWGR